MTMMMSAARRMKIHSVKEAEDEYASRALPKQLAGNLSKSLSGHYQKCLQGLPLCATWLAGSFPVWC